MLDGLLHDLLYSLRTLRRSPVFAAVATLTLGLGIGANTAIFSVVNSVLLRPLPYQDPDRLVLVHHQLAGGTVGRATLSAPDFLDYEEHAELFDGMVATFATATNIARDGDAEGIVLSWVTPNFFDMLGITPALGRGFRPDDEIILDPRLFQDPDVTPPPLRAVLSHGLWQRRYGGDPAVLGRTLHVNGQNMTVIGIAPPNFRLYLANDVTIPTDIDVWTVWPFLTAMSRAPSGIITTVGKLKPGVTVEQAQAELAGILSGIRQQSERHETAGVQVVVTPLHDEVVGHIKPMLLIVLGAVGFVLLIACANVANLLLVRASTREREIAIRTALGSGRGAIARQMLMESIVLSLLGAAAGLLIAAGGIDLLLALKPENLPRVDQVGIDRTVLVFTLGASAIAALLFGLAPVVQSSRADVASVMRERAGGSAHRNRLRNTIIVFEVAVSVVLLIGAGLMLRTFVALSDVETGFDHEGVTTVGLSMPVFTYRQGAQRTEFLMRLQTQIRELPGVQVVGGAYPLPLAENARNSSGPYAIQSGNEEEWERREAEYRTTLPGYFESMGIRVISGRAFDDSDMQSTTALVAVINRAMAERNWPGGDAVGRQFHTQPPSGLGEGQERPPLRVIGVVENVRHASLSGVERETIYFLHRNNASDLMGLTVKTAGDPTGLERQIREVVKGLDPDLPIMEIRSMEAYVAGALAPTRFVLVLLAVFATVAVVMAAIGLYGVISFSIRQRTHEIGVRMALGAEHTRIVALVMGQGMQLTALGLAIGIGCAVLLNRVIAGLLFGVSATDPATYAGIAVVSLMIAALASYLPASRAARVNPVRALHSH